MASPVKHLAVVGHPLAPAVMAHAQGWLVQLKRQDIAVEVVEKSVTNTFAAIAYVSTAQGTDFRSLQTLFTKNLASQGVAVVPIAREDAWLLAAFLKGQNISTLTYGLGNAELVLHPNRAVPHGLDVTLKYNTLHSTLTLSVEDESELVVITAALALLVAGGIDVLDLLPLLTT